MRGRPTTHESRDLPRWNPLLKRALIEGDNLEALKILQEPFLGKIRLIYIDPPYNTGGDFIYDDDYTMDEGEYLNKSGQIDQVGQKLIANTEANGRFHSDWLSMLYPRLRLSKNLLSDDGAIFISIDDNEMDNLRKICDEVFGRENFIATIIWQKVFAPKNSARYFSEDHDYILVYAKSAIVWEPILLPRTQEMNERYKNPDDDPRGPWTSGDLQARNPYSEGTYAITCPSGRVIPGPGKGMYWRISQKKFNKLNEDSRIRWGEDGNNMPRLKRFLSEIKDGKTPQTLWSFDEVGHTQDAKKSLLKYVPFENTENVLNSVKPITLLQRIIQIAINKDENAIILESAFEKGIPSGQIT